MIFNISSGVGHSIQDIITYIENSAKKSLQAVKQPVNYTGINRNVLDNTKLKNCVGWTPGFSLEKGIDETIKRKTRS